MTLKEIILRTSNHVLRFQISQEVFNTLHRLREKNTDSQQSHFSYNFHFGCADVLHSLYNFTIYAFDYYKNNEYRSKKVLI